MCFLEAEKASYVVEMTFHVTKIWNYVILGNLQLPLH